MARYWIVVCSPEVFAKTRELGFTRHGFKSTRRGMTAKMAPGDMLAFYITGRKQFAGIARVKSGMVEEHTRIWESPKKPDEMYPFRVEIEAVEMPPEAAWIDAEPYHDRFTWTRKWPRANWALAYQGNLHEVPEEDFELLRGDIVKAAKTSAAAAR
jgi:hypothetical protein